MKTAILGLLFLASCQSGKVGVAYIDKGWTTEASIFKAGDGTPLGLRGSAGRVEMPDAWDTDWTMRYAIGPFVQIPLWQTKTWYPHTSSFFTTGFYLEPRIEAAFYPDLPTSFEPEAGLRLGYRYDFFEVFIGARLPLGNGNRHESFNPPEYRHIDAGFHPELGISWGFDF